MRQTPKIVEKMQRETRELIDELKKQRAELELRIFLARAEVRGEWEKAEKKWQELRAKAGLLSAEVKDASRDVGKSANSLAQELKKSYQRIYRGLKQP